jgi:hypothetical protein
MAQLGKNIDSLRKLNAGYLQRLSTDMKANLAFTKYLDTTGWADIEKIQPPAVKPGEVALLSRFLVQPPKVQAPPPGQAAPAKADSSKHDTTKPAIAASDAKDSTHKGQDSAKASTAKTPPPPKHETDFRDLLPDSVKGIVLDRAMNTLTVAKGNLDQPSYLYDNEMNSLRLHEIAWHEKLTLSVACMVMFLIGAPLGSIIRKGGIGMPLVIAVIFFVIFFLLNNFGKKFVKQDVLTPIGGMWMATYVLTPIGLFLIYKALHDSQLFNKEFYFRLMRNIRNLSPKKDRKAEEAV